MRSIGEAVEADAGRPRADLPLLYVAAQRLPGEPLSFPVAGDQHGAISMLGVRIG